MMRKKEEGRRKKKNSNNFNDINDGVLYPKEPE